MTLIDDENTSIFYSLSVVSFFGVFEDSGEYMIS